MVGFVPELHLSTVFGFELPPSGVLHPIVVPWLPQRHACPGRQGAVPFVQSHPHPSTLLKNGF